MSDRPAVVFGDVHGDVHKLQNLIDTIRSRFGQEVDIVSVGDLIDRGPHSKEVVSLCIKEGIISCLGNHDYWLWKMLQGKGLDDVLGPAWGVHATLKSYDCPYSGKSQIENFFMSVFPYDHKKYFNTKFHLFLKITIDDLTYWVTHAGVSDSAGQIALIRGDESDDEVMENLAIGMPHQLYFGFPNLNSPNGLHKFKTGIQIFGHQVVQNVVVSDHWIALDTGCGTRPPYTLSAVVLPTLEIIQIC